MEFQNKIAIVTGAARGIGAATARAFAREGARVVIADVDQAAGEALAAELGAAQAMFVAANAASDADARRVVEQATSAWGGVDVLVNNAGIQTFGTVESMPEDEWNRTIDVNLKSVFLLSKYAVPEMRRRGGGAIVNIASVQGLMTQPGVSAYAASKGAILAMTRSMALDYAREHIRVNSVCPGSVDTPMLRQTADTFGGGDADQALQAWGKLHALGRIAQPSEVAEVILFLAGPRASFVTGAAYLVDGGLTAAFATE